MRHWTATKHKLPKEKGKCLVTVDYGKQGTKVEVLHFDGEHFVEIGLDDVEYPVFSVLAWMPFPEPYTEKNWL